MKNMVGAVLVLVCVLSVQATVLIQDDFAGMSAGDNISNSVLEVGSATWIGSLESNGENIMRAPVDPGVLEGAAIALPEFSDGDIITIKARVACTDGTDWFGLGFSTSSDVLSTLGNNTPWSTFYASSGGANVCGGPSVAGALGIAYRADGGVGTAETEMQFVYDTGAGTVTVIYGGQTIRDNAVVTPTAPPSLDYAFFVMRNAEVGGGAPGSYITTFEVSVEPSVAGTVIIRDDFSGLSAGNNISNSIPEIGSGVWSGRLISDGYQVVRAPSSPLSSEGATINLPEFSADAVISIKARVGLSDGAGWWGIGFTDIPYAPSASLSSNSPWALFRSGGQANVCGGYSTANALGYLTRTNGAVSGLFDIEFIYDVESGTVTSVFDGETLHDNMPIVTPGTSSLGYAFIYFYDAASGGITSGTYFESFEVSLLSGFAVGEGFNTWAKNWGVDIGSETNDYDNDGLLNIYEYGLGGNPTNPADKGTAPVCDFMNVGGTNYFCYIHPLVADLSSGLSYTLATSTNLVTGNWVVNSGYMITGTNVTGGELNLVTNMMDMASDSKFVQLLIE